MAATIAEFFLRKWVEENLPGSQLKVEGRCGYITDKNGDTLNIMYDRESRRIICLDDYNSDF